VVPGRTLAGPGAQSPAWRLLGRRRLALFILNSVERGTRWMLFEPNDPSLWKRAGSQLRDFFETLEAEGAFAGRAPDDRWFVVCDERVNRDSDREAGVVNLLFGFPAGRAGQFHSYLVSHRAGGSRVRPVSLNRFQAETARPESLLDAVESIPLTKAG